MAGKRAGLAGERSGLFMEQIRIVKEMREEDRRAGKPAYLIRPRFMVWENVPGAFSSNKGEDFRAVLEETIRIAEPDAPDIPLPPKFSFHHFYCEVFQTNNVIFHLTYFSMYLYRVWSFP